MAFEVYAHFNPSYRSPGAHRKILVYSTESNNEDFIIPSSLRFEVNKSSSFNFSILPNNTEYDNYEVFSTYIEIRDITDSQPEIIFYGRINGISINFDKSKEMTCEGLLSILKDCTAFRLTNMNSEHVYDDMNGVDWDDYGAEVFHNMVHAYQLGADDPYSIKVDEDDPNYGVSVTDAISQDDAFRISFEGSLGTTPLDFIASNLVDVLGGVLRMEYYVDESEAVKGMLYWDPDPTDNAFSKQKNNQVFEAGVNILDLSSENLQDEPITGINVEYVFKNGDSEENCIITENVYDSSYGTVYVPYLFGNKTGSIKWVKLPGTFKGKSGQSTAQKKQTARENAIKRATAYQKLYCSNSPAEMKKKYTIRALDMHYFGDLTKDKYQLLDPVDIKSPEHGVDTTISGSTERFYILSMEINITDMTQNSYTISDYLPDPSSDSKILSKRIAQNRR